MEKVRINFELLDFEVSKLYLKPIDPNDIEGVMKHCDFISQFIEAAGWTCEEYVDQMWSRTHREEMMAN